MNQSKEDIERRLELECEITLEIIKKEMQDCLYLDKDYCITNIDHKKELVIRYIISSLKQENIYSYVEVRNNMRYLIINLKDDYYCAIYKHKKKQKEEYEKKIRREKMILVIAFYASMIGILMFLGKFM